MYDMYPFHQNILLRPHLKWLKELSNAILWLSTYVQDRILSQTFRSKLLWQFWQKKKEKKKELNELSEMYRKNRKYSKNNKFNKDSKL